jgi:hypothetical protein
LSFRVFAHVCLERLAPGEVSAKEKTFEAHGWAWVKRTHEHVVLMKKDFASNISERDVEQEIKDVMGAAYVGLAAPGSPKDLSGAHGEAFWSERRWEIASAHAWLEQTDADGHRHGSGQQVIRPRPESFKSDE